MENSIKEINITEIKGIKDARAAAFAKLGVYTLSDLITLYPVRYENRTIIKKICELEENDEISLCAYVRSISKRQLKRNLTLHTVSVSDGTGTLNIIFYNQNYIQRTLKINGYYVFFGKVTRGFAKQFEIQNPVFEDASSKSKLSTFMRCQPVYPLAKGLTQSTVRNAVSEALRMAYNAAGGYREMQIDVPHDISEKFRLMSKKDALNTIHFPKDTTEAESARRRLAFDELLELQLMLHLMKSDCCNQIERGIDFAPCDIHALTDLLPFTLTDAQMSVWEDIEKDMENKLMMNRLVIGDVGSGKTVIAMLAMFKAISNGYQAVYMAPTEILAEQHYKNINNYFSALGINTAFLTGALTASRKKEIKRNLASGEIQCIIGTHALIQDDVIFQKAGIVITDEQHRFGVRQRALLSMQNTSPDILVMTATPIPRTLALILYGDMDISSVTALPVGRLPIKTYTVDSSMHNRIYEWIKKLVRAGQQAYIIHPLVENSNDIETPLLSATDNYNLLSNSIFADIPTGLLHGKMKSADKDSVMRQFADGKIKILFTTTVVEVGVDVSNATVIVIENADRFGLSQLHQLRGRVGRGKLQSHCVLVTDNKSKLVKKRMEIMCSGCDGFAISEKDLELRGPGDFFGTAQHGIPDFKAANLYNDIDILHDAQEAAMIIAKDKDTPEYSEYKNYIGAAQGTVYL